MAMASLPDSLPPRLALAEVVRAPVPLIVPAGYRLNDKGLFWEDNDNNYRLIAGPFKVLALTRDRHNQSWGLLLEWADHDGRTHRMAVARAALAGDGREVRQALLDKGLHVSASTRERNALQAFLTQVTTTARARAVSRVGWQDGCFALPDRTIAPDDADLVVYQGQGLAEHDYQEAGTLEGWQAQVAAPAIGNSRLAIALCAGLVGPLLAWAGAEGGGLHLRGPSSIGKSTALEAAASIWGPKSFVRQWRATANGLEGAAELANETLLVLDELAQLAPGDAGSVAYMLANGCGKSRAAQNGDARAAKRWQTFFLSSGEVSLADHARSDGRGRRNPAGQEVRILDIEADAGAGLGLFNTLHDAASGDSLSRAIKHGAGLHHGHAGPAFVRSLLGQQEAVAKLVRIGIEAFTRQNLPPGAGGQEARVCHRLGLLAMAGELATRNGILPWPESEATRAAKAIFADWLAARGGIGAAEDRAAVQQVAGFLAAHGASRFQPITGEAPTIVANRAGFWRDDSQGGQEFLISTKTWREEVCQGLNPSAVAQVLIREGYLRPGTGNKSSQSLSVPGLGKQRCYVISSRICGDEAA